MTLEALIAKAITAASSAHSMLELGDADGAVNRAYYAMFDAARAALMASGLAHMESDVGRTHSGLIGAFGQVLVNDGRVPRELGRLLNRAHEVRQIADYTGVSVEPADASLLALQRLLSKRFGEIPAGVAEQISKASAEQIEGWLDQVLEASSLESLFGNIH
ncbi:HEPN domain-containing protein [Magnetovirga frankeli]|uniref:HEPN domain-containing protein n=1 Tax=Magnetovirga frankeli TaxID=947516 RepID=UPI003D336105